MRRVTGRLYAFIIGATIIGGAGYVWAYLLAGAFSWLSGAPITTPFDRLLYGGLALVVCGALGWLSVVAHELGEAVLRGLEKRRS